MDHLHSYCGFYLVCLPATKQAWLADLVIDVIPRRTRLSDLRSTHGCGPAPDFHNWRSGNSGLL